jgi:hypothetical protein
VFENDYIMRQVQHMIQAFANLVATVLGLKQAGKYAEASQAVSESYDGLVGLSHDFVHNMSAEALLAMLSQGGPTFPDNAIVLSELLTLEGSLLDKQERSECARNCYRKALDILIEVVLAFPERELEQQNRTIVRLGAQLAGEDLTVATRDRIEAWEEVNFRIGPLQKFCCPTRSTPQH